MGSPRVVCYAVLLLGLPLVAQEHPFGKRFKNLDSMATGKWWEKARRARARDEVDAKSNDPKARRRHAQYRRFVPMDVPRDQVVAFALYTHDAGTLKLSAQLYPLLPDEPREVRLELERDGAWREVATAKVIELGWSAHFRIEHWDSSKNVRYRVRHGARAQFEGLVRRDPTGSKLVVGVLSCDSSRTPGLRPNIVRNLKRQDPDLLFFAGDQTYHHTQHTAGWIQFGVRFREVLRDRPVICIPDDHDVGQANLWGEDGKKATNAAGPSGGYFYPPAYVNMVQRQQTWHLPDPYDPTPVKRGIHVYYTRLRVGGVDFAILEDRKWKSGRQGKVPKMRRRPDHIIDPSYDRKAIDVKGLVLLGERQLHFLRAWSEDWTGADLKVVLSQTAFCGAVHMHGRKNARVLADLDSNAWPQTGRNKALRAIRRARALHICGDQHLAVFLKHGIDGFRDGPYAFTVPAIVNTIYGRWWHPLDEKPGPNPVVGSPLPWTGDYRDGLGNPISMIAYANPKNVRNEKQRGDGYGVVRFDKPAGTARIECWPRFCNVADGDKAQYPGWPIEIRLADNDGRKIYARLPALPKAGVVQVVRNSDQEMLYTVRAGKGWRPPVFAPGKYTVKLGADHPDETWLKNQDVQ